MATRSVKPRHHPRSGVRGHVSNLGFDNKVDVQRWRARYIIPALVDLILSRTIRVCIRATRRAECSPAPVRDCFASSRVAPVRLGGSLRLISIEACRELVTASIAIRSACPPWIKTLEIRCFTGDVVGYRLQMCVEIGVGCCVKASAITDQPALWRSAPEPHHNGARRDGPGQSPWSLGAWWSRRAGRTGIAFCTFGACSARRTRCARITFRSLRARRAGLSLRPGRARRALQAVEINPILAIPHRDLVGATHYIDVAIYRGLNIVEVGPLGHLACYL